MFEIFLKEEKAKLNAEQILIIGTIVVFAVMILLIYSDALKAKAASGGRTLE